MQIILTRGLVAALLFIGSIARAQDIIVKTDKTEIKAKVTEITEMVIKYKKWDNQNGPVYNIARSEVFMILYANGQREIIQKTTPAASQPPAPSPAGSNLSSQLKQAASPGVDTALDYQNIKVKYAPTRLLYWFDNPPTTLGLEKEFRIVKNVLNLGIGAHYSFVSGYSQGVGAFFLAPYLPLNRLTGAYDKQDKGLFLSGKIGYAGQTITIDGENFNTSGFMIGFGADYYFFKGFGLTLTGFKYGESKFGMQGGLSFTF
jgi:hypothetical protein